MNQSTLGDLAELEVLTALTKAGYRTSVPFGSYRYDLVAEVDGKFQRVQVKLGRMVGGTIKFRTVASTAGTHQHYLNDADSFGVYCPELDEVYLIPVNDVPATGEAHLRIDLPLNGQQKGVRWAKDYVVVAQSG